MYWIRKYRKIVFVKSAIVWGSLLSESASPMMVRLDEYWLCVSAVLHLVKARQGRHLPEALTTLIIVSGDNIGIVNQ